MADLPQDEIATYFRAEVPGLLAELESGLSRLRQEHSLPAYYRLLRAAHSLKGGAASVSMYGIQTLAQCLEDVFQTLLAQPDTDISLIEDLLLQGFDCLRLPLSQWLNTGVCDPDFGLRRAKVIYEQLTHILGPVPTTIASVSSADLQVDVTQTIFDHDIAPKIAEIQALLAQSEPSSLEGELRAQFDLLGGLGEMLRLGGFARINRVAVEALIHHSEQARVIGELALRDLQMVMGNRYHQGEPSPELLAWAARSQDGVSELLQAEMSSPILGNFLEDMDGEINLESSDGSEANASSIFDDFFWEEVNEITLPQWHSLTSENVEESNQLGTLDQAKLASLWEELDETDSMQVIDPEPENSTNSLWEELNEIYISEPTIEPITEPTTPEPENLTDSFWEEVSEISVTQSITELTTEPTILEPENLTDSFWEEVSEINQSEVLKLHEPPSSWTDSQQEPTSNPLTPQWTGPALPPSTDINREALEFFAQEAQDLLQELESGLLTLRQNHDIPYIHALMRAAHSIKGGAATVGLPVIQVIAHRLENALQTLYQWPGELDVPLEAALLQAFDTLRQPLQSQLTVGSFDLDNVLQKAEQAFLELEAILGNTEPTGGDAYVPSSQDLGVDMTATIFGGDIQQGLDRLQTLSVQPAGDWVAEVTSQLEVFANLGELLNLSGWRAVCQAGLTALEQYPEQALEITQVLCRNLRQSYDQVMAGEREYGGKISPELQAFLAGNITQILMENLTSNVPLISNVEVSAEPNNEVGAELGTQVNVLSNTRQELTSKQQSTGVLTQANINRLFSELPPAMDLVPPASATPTKVPSTPTQPTRGPSVRVEVSRLERLNNLIGELVIQENGAFLYQQQLQKLVQTFGQRLNKFETISRMLQDTADQLTLTANSIHTPKNEFDPLQMDSYNQLYTWVQTVIEEIAQVGEVMRDMGLVNQQSQENLRKKQQTLKQIRGDLLWIRMVPLQEILQRFPRMVRDLCIQHQKQVQVRLVGANTLVDKAVLEKLTDPLVHLVRNAFDHGVESPQIRIQKGKKTEGNIEIQAYYRGNQTHITVGDDGQGIDLERVRQKAIEKQIFTPEQGANATKSELLNCLFTPGFSTATTVSDLSGRGVGLDVVRLQIQELKGSIHIHTEPGQGTTFTIRLPLTLTITKLLVFNLDRRLFALAVDGLAAIITVSDEALITMQGRQLVSWQGRLVPVIPPSVLEYRYPVRWVSGEGSGLNLPAGQGRPLLLLSVDNAVYGLEIDQILLEQDLVIKPFSGLLQPPAYVYGCTILGDGRLVPVLDGAGLVNHWLRTPEVGAVVARVPVRTVQQTEILVVDDSLTIRGTLGKMLTKHGYRVHTAADGREALELLAQNPQIQAIFSDIEMPRMNGFEFLSACRQDPRYQNLPIIMLTSRAGEKHQKMAENLGCNAYLTKPYLEPDLLQTLKQFVSAN